MFCQVKSVTPSPTHSHLSWFIWWYTAGATCGLSYFVAKYQMSSGPYGPIFILSNISTLLFSTEKYIGHHHQSILGYCSCYLDKFQSLMWSRFCPAEFGSVKFLETVCQSADLWETAQSLSHFGIFIVQAPLLSSAAALTETRLRPWCGRKASGARWRPTKTPGSS